MHVKECYPLFTLNYLEGAGQLDGELMETVWSPLKEIISSTRSMTLQHRREVIDDQIRDHNWKKALASGLLFHHIG